MFLSEFYDLLDHWITLSGIPVVVCDFSVHFDGKNHLYTKMIADLLDVFQFTQSSSSLMQKSYPRLGGAQAC